MVDDVLVDHVYELWMMHEVTGEAGPTKVLFLVDTFNEVKPALMFAREIGGDLEYVHLKNLAYYRNAFETLELNRVDTTHPNHFNGALVCWEILWEHMTTKLAYVAGVLVCRMLTS